MKREVENSRTESLVYNTNARNGKTGTKSQSTTGIQYENLQIQTQCLLTYSTYLLKTPLDYMVRRLRFARTVDEQGE